MDSRLNSPAANKMLSAARIREEGEFNHMVNGFSPDPDRDAALKHEASALELLTDPRVTQRSTGGELVPMPTANAFPATYKDTMATPSLVTAEASRARLDLAYDAGVLAETLDLCETISAENNAERMLAAQMASLHRLTMKTAELANGTTERLRGIVQTRDREAGTVQLNRLANTMARASSAFQEGMLTLNKVRSGGKQNITVTHIQNTQVNQGGQAVVTSHGAVASGGQEGGKTIGKDQ